MSNGYTFDNLAELDAMVAIGECSRSKAKRAMSYLAEHFDTFREDVSGMGVSERVTLALALV